MERAIEHRGPDGSGVWTTPDQRVGFAHRRLAIIDLSHTADQPMSTRDGRVVVTYNGEIYNHRELRRELVTRGREFFTDHSDTEVLLHGYLEWGMDGLLARLNGIFAFALYDKASGSVFLVRDHAGVKPLYFAPTTDGIAFGSEIKSILAGGRVQVSIAPLPVYHYLAFMTAPAPYTLFQDIFKLPAGTYVEVDASGGTRSCRYYDLLAESQPPARPVSFEQSVGDVRGLLDQAVERQCLADVPVGVFLSGGVDSSALTALATRRIPGQVNAFSVGFEDHTALNEIDDAAKIATHFGAKHHVVKVSARDMRDYVERLSYDQDEPIADWVCIPLYFVSKLAHDNGMKVVLVGEGADELFCGYPVYRRYLELAQKEWRIARLAAALGLGNIAGDLLERRGRGDFGALARADFFRRAANGDELFWGGAVVWWNSLKRHLINEGNFPTDARTHPMARALVEFSGADLFDSGRIVSTMTNRARDEGRDRLGAMTYFELGYRLPELLLMRVDKITMANSLEARVPFLDRDMVSYALGMTQDQKIPGMVLKKVLKEAVRGLIPDAVIDAPKRGFGAPMSEWLRGEFGNICRERIMDGFFVRESWFNGDLVDKLIRDHQKGHGDNAVFIWTLFNLSAWADTWTGR